MSDEARPFRHLSRRQLKRAYRRAFKQWEYCVERYYSTLTRDHLNAMKQMADELDARRGLIWEAFSE